MLWLVGRFLRRLTLVSGAIWLLTLPLVMARFHIFNPIAVLINTAVWLPMAGALVSGLALLLCSMIPGPLAAVCAVFCNWLLAAVEWLVRFGEQVPYGHSWVPGPAEWWLIGLYAGLAIFAAFPRLRPPLRWRLALLGAWTAAGFIIPWWTTDRHGLRCTLLSVGHGEAIVLGTARRPHGALRRRPLGGADRLLPHHFGLPVVAGPDAHRCGRALARRQRSLQRLAGTAGAVFRGNGLRLAGDVRRAERVDPIPARGHRAGEGADSRDCLRRSLVRRPGLSAGVLHPPPHGLPATSNANSIVLSVEYGGRRVFLPADLQSPGLDDVLAERPLHCDLLLVPHHGSRTSMPAELSAWSTPDWSVFSADHRYDTSAVEAIYAKHGRVLHTADTGAVMARVDEKGMGVETFVGGKN